MTNEAASNADTAISKRSVKDWGSPFKPGQSGNPSGRPPGFNALIRDKTLDGLTLVEHAISLLQGKAVNGLTPSPELSFRALEWLADRGWGKAVQNVEHSGTMIHAWDILKDLSNEQLEAIAEAARVQNEAMASAIEGEGRVLTDDVDVSSSQSGEVS